MQDHGFRPGGDLIADLFAAWGSGVSHHPDHGHLDDQVNVTGAQQNGLAGVQRLWFSVLP
ncbi:hypothetical protein ACLQ2R_05125 [Streptosporangium sp. DT93]|uniref:hypothetical protein n=1 Tax=Streptosporangium sp. DT93 TaxID=3393428 RepID=UPI003CF2A9BF